MQTTNLLINTKVTKECHCCTTNGYIFAWATALIDSKAKLRVSWQITVLYRKDNPLIPTKKFKKNKIQMSHKECI